MAVRKMHEVADFDCMAQALVESSIAVKFIQSEEDNRILPCGIALRSIPLTQFRGLALPDKAMRQLAPFLGPRG